MKIPTWISTMTEEVSKKNNIETPIIAVRRIQRSYSGLQSSEGGKKKITIRYSSLTPMWQKKMVLLHELAHCIAPDKAHHSDKFWEIAIGLYKEYKLPIRKVLKKETGYRKQAEKTFRTINGMKPKKIKRRKVALEKESQFDRLSREVLGISYFPFKKCYVVVVQREPIRGIRITVGLYNKLVKKGTYPII